MRCSGRNRQQLYYALYDGVTTTTDEWGNENGQDVSYTEPQALYANVSAAKNAEFADIFGINIDYDRVLMLPVRDYPIDEHSVLWLDGADPTKDSFNYVVRRVSRSVNFTAIAIKRVDVVYEQSSSQSNTNAEQHTEPDNGTGGVLPESGQESPDSPGEGG